VAVSVCEGKLPRVVERVSDFEHREGFVLAQLHELRMLGERRCGELEGTEGSLDEIEPSVGGSRLPLLPGCYGHVCDKNTAFGETKSSDARAQEVFGQTAK
jgi:hypothetical protein